MDPLRQLVVDTGLPGHQEDAAKSGHEARGKDAALLCWALLRKPMCSECFQTSIPFQDPGQVQSARHAVPKHSQSLRRGSDRAPLGAVIGTSGEKSGHERHKRTSNLLQTTGFGLMTRASMGRQRTSAHLCARRVDSDFP